MSDIRKLIEAVEDGVRLPLDGSAYRLIGDDWLHVFDAYNGSLDAAKALHEALLPDDYWINWFDLDGIVQIKNSEDDTFDGKAVPNPARAWLLSILKAYEAQ